LSVVFLIDFITEHCVDEISGTPPEAAFSDVPLAYRMFANPGQYINECHKNVNNNESSAASHQAT